MNSQIITLSFFRSGTLAILFSLTLPLCGCHRSDAPRAPRVNPLSLALAPNEGTTRTDIEIRKFQERIRAGHTRSASIERLGWLYVTKARESFDPGFYKLAEACATVLETDSPGCAEGLLLRGHVLENLHRFKEAEPLARELVTKRGLSFDYALLGDSLMEQGRLTEAVAAYQSMMDLRPDLHAYSRAAHVRWLTGDVEGAKELMQAAVNASSSEDSEAAAWVSSRLGFYQFQTGDNAAAEHCCAMALAFCPDYPPALLLRGKMMLAGSNATEAVEILSRAARINPLPEYQWLLAEAQRAAGRSTEAEQVESVLRRSGAAADPRTFSLYLATRGTQGETALRLAREELQQRQDVFTHDALAWALLANGRLNEAHEEMSRAVAAGTEDGRLYFHAAVIAANSGHEAEAKQWMEKTALRVHLLLPSERKEFQTLVAKLQGTDLALTSADMKNVSSHNN